MATINDTCRTCGHPIFWEGFPADDVWLHHGDEDASLALDQDHDAVPASHNSVPDGATPVRPPVPTETCETCGATIVWSHGAGLPKHGGWVHAGVEVEAAADHEADTGRRFTTDECDEGQTFSLAEMIDANEEDEDLHEWLRAAKPGDQYRDIVTVTCVR